jgi:hypothetical protein
MTIEITSLSVKEWYNRNQEFGNLTRIEKQLYESDFQYIADRINDKLYDKEITGNLDTDNIDIDILIEDQIYDYIGE